MGRYLFSMLLPLSIVIPSCIWLLTDPPGITLHSFLAFCLYLRVGGGLSRFLMTFSITHSMSYSFSFMGCIPRLRHRLLERDWCGCTCSFRFSVIVFFSVYAYTSMVSAWYVHLLRIVIVIPRNATIRIWYSCVLWSVSSLQTFTHCCCTIK